MGETTYDVGTGLAIPGLEAVIEYGDATSLKNGCIDGAMRINDRSTLERVRLDALDGLHGDPEGRDTREPDSDRDGETPGLMRYAGRTIGLTGGAEAGSILAMRDQWTKLYSQFGKRERDLLVHPVGEKMLYTNEIVNPDPQLSVNYWLGLTGAGGVTPVAPAISTSVGNSQPVGQFSQASAVVDGSGNVLRYYATRVDGSDYPWLGDDIYLGVYAACTGTTLSALELVLRYTYGSTTSEVLVSSVSSPTGSTFYWMSGRVAASTLPKNTTSVTLMVRVKAAAGTATSSFTHACMVFVDQDEDSPVGYIGPAVAGFEHTGAIEASSSCGPLYLVNRVRDPSVSEVRTSDSVVLGFSQAQGSPVTTVQDVVLTKSRIDGAESDSSYYFYAQKDATATARALGVKLTHIDFDYSTNTFLVSPGRTYRFSAIVDLDQKPTTDKVCLELMWARINGTAPTPTQTAALVLGPQYVELYAVAPAHAFYVLPRIVAPDTTESAAKVELSFTDVVFMDVTDENPDVQTVGMDKEWLEVIPKRVYTEINGVQYPINNGARRRLIRPFLIKRVRKTSDSKASERQADRKYRRDFTMTLRAADPRIYVLDERRALIKMSGTSKFVADTAPASFTLEADTLGVPTGYTYEGHNVTKGASGSPFDWSQERSADRPLVYRPNGGVGLKAWAGGGSSGFGSPANTPSSDFKSRMYRSAEGYTYTTPRVVLGCAPGTAYGSRSLNPRAMSIADITGTTPNKKVRGSDATILLKRVNSTTWLELRWNSVSKAWLDVLGVGSENEAMYAFELWCSHNVSGTLSTTRLQTWDYTSYDSSSGLYPFDHNVDSMWLTSWMISNVVYWELWNTYPSSITTTGRVESGSYAVPAGLQSTIGTSVAGSSGWSLKIDNYDATDDIQWKALAWNPPYMHYFEESDATLLPKSAFIPIVGSIETPAVIKLHGDLIDPVLSIAVPEYDGDAATASVARFSGTTLESDPIYVDLVNGSVRDSAGNNRRDLIVPGSDFVLLRPGNNTLSVQAKGWGSSYSSHVTTSWRDALR